MTEQELFCYRDLARVCGAHCVAYVTSPKGDDATEAWAHCVVLASEHRKARHLVVIAHVVSKMREEQEKAARMGVKP